MRFSLRTLSIVGASVLSLGLITAAFIVSGNSREVSAQNAEELLRAYAERDTDSDGLPDWQEALYASDPTNPNSIDASMTDSAAVEAGLVKPRFESEEIPESTLDIDSVPGVTAAPNTVTDRFARLFFEQYFTLRGSEQPSTDELLAFIEDAVTELSETNQIPRAYSLADVKTSGSGSLALQAYAVGAERAFMLNAAGADRDAMYYFSQVMYKNDTSALTQLAALSRAYATSADTLIRVPAPRELSNVHLRLANALALIGTVTEDLAAVEDDPLRAFLVLEQYEQAIEELANTLVAYDSIYDAARLDITVGQGDPGFVFYSLIDSAGATKERLSR